MRKQLSSSFTVIKRHTTKPTQFLVTSSQSSREGLPSHPHRWVEFAACLGQGEGTSPPFQEGSVFRHGESLEGSLLLLTVTFFRHSSQLLFVYW